ncbi:hypothetical protein, partial [Fretibacterium fastidiosum]|uniref:hypothetical protein n=1 Tax=Fretibacterium fastidiosum TaxID=651822 RepID=UPI001AD80B10
LGVVLLQERQGLVPVRSQVSLLLSSTESGSVTASTKLRTKKGMLSSKINLLYYIASFPDFPLMLG